jgi:ABC-type sugar transport system permease subunit
LRPRALAWIIPALIMTAAIKLFPLIQVSYWSLSRTTFSASNGAIGLENYANLVSDPLLRTSLINNVILLASVPLSIIIALILSSVLFGGIKGARFFEALYFLPFIPAVASVSVVFLYFLGDNGPINTLLRAIGGDEAGVAWLTTPGLASWTVMGVMTWKRIGLFTLLIISRLMSVNRELFEAAAVDGASWPVTFRKIAMPQLRRILSFASLIGVIEVFSYGFGYIFVLTQGGPYNTTYTLEFLLYRTLFQRFNIGVAAAIAVVIIAIVTAVAAIQLRWQRRATT